MQLGLSESTASYSRTLISRFAAVDNLQTYDPYDVWKTRIGFYAKDLYNRRPLLGLPVVAPLALVDDTFNNGPRWCYRKQEYPIVRALAALTLVAEYRKSGDATAMATARRHLEWLAENTCTGYHGHCWGLGFPYAVRRDIVYGSNTPLATMTPYALEAFAEYTETTGDPSFESVIASTMRFFDCDVQTMYEDSDTLATSYGPYRDRIVVNAVSYTMFANALSLSHASRLNTGFRREKIRKLFAYVRGQQRLDGSWLYSPEGRSFIDCFHTCIVLKNIVKTHRLVELQGADDVIAAGYAYLKHAFLDEKRFLMRRFSVKNKPGLIRFDLYDNAETLNIAALLGDHVFARRLLASILRTFCTGLDVYSQIDFLGLRRNRNTLRWAVMPFLYAVSQLG